MIRFEENGHRYFDGEKELISVSALMAKHGLAPDYSGVSESVLKAKAERGTLIHKEIEDYIKTGECGFTPECFHFSEYIEESGIKVEASEKIVGNDICAGTIDLLLRNANGAPMIADIKTTAKVNYDAVSWQLSIYNALSGWGATEFLVFHFDKDGILRVTPISPKPPQEVESLFEAERQGRMFFEEVPEIFAHTADIAALVAVEATIKHYTELADKAKKKADEMKAAIIKAMEENGIKTFEGEGVKITYIAPTESRSIDAARLREDFPDLAEKYEKTTFRKASLKITPKKGATE